MRAVAVAVLCVLAASAHGESRIVVVETKGAPALPTLAPQITLHADGKAFVSVQQAPAADPLTYAETASKIDAALVVWIAPVDGGYLVFVAGTANRALTELVRIDANLGAPEIERTIALKVAGLLDAVLAPVPVAEVLQAKIVLPLRNEWRLEIEGLIAYEAHERSADGRVALLFGRTWKLGAWTLVPSAGGYWQPSGTIERIAGRASIVELGGIVAAEGGRPLGLIEAFVRPHITAAGIAARGVSNDGRRGQATVFAPYVGLEVGARYAVSNVRFGVVTGLDFALIERRLVIDEETVVDLGAMRLHVGLSMTVSL